MASTVLPKLIGDMVSAGKFGTFCAIDGMFENNGNGVSSHRFTYNDTLITRNSDNKITINKSGTLNLICMSAAAKAFDGGSRFTIKLNDVALSVTEYDRTNVYCRYTEKVVAGDVLYIQGNDIAYTDEAGYAVTFLDCSGSGNISSKAPWSESGTIGQAVTLKLSESMPYSGTVVVDMFIESSGQSMLMPRAGLTKDSVQLKDGEGGFGSNYKLTMHTTLTVTKGCELWIYCGKSATGNSGTFARYSAFYSAYN